MRGSGVFSLPCWPCRAVWMGTAAVCALWERRRRPEPTEVFFIPSTKAHSLLSQIRMKRFPFQLLPPSLCVYLNPQPRGFSANKLPSFQVAFPFSHCFWQPVHVKLGQRFFILAVFVFDKAHKWYTRACSCLGKSQHPSGVEALQRMREFQPGKDPCCSSSSSGDPTRGLPGSISWVAIKAAKVNVPPGLLINWESSPG